MTGYSKSKIYIITNSINEETYVGSTTESLKSRLYHHIYNSKKILRDAHRNSAPDACP